MGYTKKDLESNSSMMFNLLGHLDLKLKYGEPLPWNIDDLLKQFTIKKNVCKCTGKNLFHCVNGHCFNCGLVILEGFPHSFKAGRNEATGNFFVLNENKRDDGNG